MQLLPELWGRRQKRQRDSLGGFEGAGKKQAVRCVLRRAHSWFSKNTQMTDVKRPGEGGQRQGKTRAAWSPFCKDSRLK